MDDWRELVKRGITILVIMGIVWLICNPLVWICWGWVILKALGLLLLAAIVSRIVFKKSLKDIIFGEDDD